MSSNNRKQQIEESLNITKKITLGAEARKLLASGVNQVADPVKITLGAKGQTVIIETNTGGHHITADGATVANYINVSGSVERMGANIIKSISAQAAELTGDGTTTATILAQSLINQGIELIDTGYSPIDVKKYIEEAVKFIIKDLREQSIEVKDSQIFDVATISANGDTEIGKLVSDMMLEIGKSGQIKVVSSNDSKTSSKVLKGLKIDNGYDTSIYVNNPSKGLVEYNNPYILLLSNSIDDFNRLVPILSVCAKANRPLLILYPHMDGQVLNTIIGNVRESKGTFGIVTTKLDVMGSLKDDTLVDIATLTGGTVITELPQSAESEFNIDFLGTCNSVEVTKDYTLIIGGHGEDKEVEDRVKIIGALINDPEMADEKISLESRLSSLTGGVGVIYVGGNTQTEITEKIDRIDDAIGATKSAMEEGILQGGGVALFKAANNLNNLPELNSYQRDVQNIVTFACMTPIKQILDNGGFETNKILKAIANREFKEGFNVVTEKYVDMIKEGIIDPTKVTVVALKSAVSAAVLLLLSGAVVTRE